MTDKKLLDLLFYYYNAQRDVVLAMTFAMEYFEHGLEQESFSYLFEWCENKDRREELFANFNNNYARAVMLKEGHELWK